MPEVGAKDLRVGQPNFFDFARMKNISLIRRIEYFCFSGRNKKVIHNSHMIICIQIGGQIGRKKGSLDLSETCHLAALTTILIPNSHTAQRVRQNSL